MNIINLTLKKHFMKFSNSQILALILFLISFVVSLVVVFNYAGEISQMKHLLTINFLIITNIVNLFINKLF